METNQSSSPSHCPVCGEPLPENATQGLCPHCLLKAATEEQGDSVPVAGFPGMPASPDLAEIAGYFPHWEVQEVIGRGGMSTVYKVRQPLIDRMVALKILPVELAQTPGFSERFAQEARMLAKLSHTNIVAIHDFGQAGPYYYVLMEYVDGVNLRQAMEAGRFSARQALSVVRAMCDALEYAHGEGVVHRDIKPENILLDAAGKVKLVDFGIGKLASAINPGAPYLTVTGDGLGTPHYMAPEQVERARDVDHRADIYSLGVVFYEMLTGELPLGRFAEPSKRAPLDPGVDPVVMKALERQRENRQQDAARLRHEVNEVEAGAAPKPLPAPQQQISARNPWLLRGVLLKLAGVLVFAALVLGSKNDMNRGDRLNADQNAASARIVWVDQALRETAKSIQDRYTLPEGDYLTDDWYQALLKARENPKTYISSGHVPMPLEDALASNLKATEAYTELLTLAPDSLDPKSESFSKFMEKLEQVRQKFDATGTLSYLHGQLTSPTASEANLEDTKKRIASEAKVTKDRVDQYQEEVDGKAFRKMQKEKLSQLLDEKKAAKQQFDAFQQNRIAMAGPRPPLVNLGFLVEVPFIGGGCLCGWLALAFIRRMHLSPGRGLGLFLALMVPLALLGGLIGFVVTDLVQHMQWKNLELVKSASRGLAAVAWLMASLWIVATCWRWASNSQPVMAKLHRGFLFLGGGLATLFLLILLQDQLR